MYVAVSTLQAECISRALQGSDIVAQARTGSGKTLAYVLPALQKLLELPQAQQSLPCQTLVLVPTRELCEQVCRLLATCYTKRLEEGHALTNRKGCRDLVPCNSDLQVFAETQFALILVSFTPMFFSELSFEITT